MNKVVVENLNLCYSDGVESLKNINFNIQANSITVLFGPAGGGKSTFLRVLNRLNDLADVSLMSGKVLFNGINILDPKINVIDLRRKIGMVFSRPVPLPLTIYNNVSFGLELIGKQQKSCLDETVEQALTQATLWEEVKDRLNDPAYSLSGGQQQRLCLARALALKPEMILLDEPTSALDPIATNKIESLLQELKQHYTIVLAPHNTQQATRMADFAAFFLQGELIEYDLGVKIFTNPKDHRTREYIEGRFG